MTDIQENLVLLGKELEAARREAGLSASEVAGLAGCSTAYVRTIERGVNPKTHTASRPSATILRGLARAVRRDPHRWFELAGYERELADVDPQPAKGGVDYYLRSLADAAKLLPQRSPFMNAQATNVLRNLANEFERAARGSIIITPIEEPELTQQAVNSCQQHLRAVSFQDEDWWQGTSGETYLEHHEQLRKRGVEITRIFLVAQDAVELLVPTLEKHIELRMTAYVLDVDNVDQSLRRDFVIYDDALLREASSVDADDLDLKEAEFTDDPVRIEGALLKFDRLRTAAIAFGGEAERVLRRRI